ncbi:MAG: hypothetical protein U0350_23725 [Caldilineaceae bacterium]
MAADKEVRIALDGTKVDSVKIVNLNPPPTPSTAEKVLYFVIGIPVLLYFIFYYCF